DSFVSGADNPDFPGAFGRTRAGCACCSTYPDVCMTPLYRLAVAAILLVVLSAGGVHAQSHLYPETIVPHDPLLDGSRSTEQAFLRTMDFWGDIGMYAGLRDDRHRWGISLGGRAELYGASAWNVLFETNLHLTADP